MERKETCLQGTKEAGWKKGNLCLCTLQPPKAVTGKKDCTLQSPGVEFASAAGLAAFFESNHGMSQAHHQQHWGPAPALVSRSCMEQTYAENLS